MSGDYQETIETESKEDGEKKKKAVEKERREGRKAAGSRGDDSTQDFGNCKAESLSSVIVQMETYLLDLSKPLKKYLLGKSTSHCSQKKRKQPWRQDWQ